MLRRSDENSAPDSEMPNPVTPTKPPRIAVAGHGKMLQWHMKILPWHILVLHVLLSSMMLVVWAGIFRMTRISRQADYRILKQA